MDPKVKMLIKDLKDKSPDIRQTAVKELGKLQVEGAVRPLIKMANGNMGFFKRYNAEDQLAAIEALAEIGSRKAWRFIKRINEVKQTRYSGHWEQGDNYIDVPVCDNADYILRNVKGALRGMVSYSYSYDGIDKRYDKSAEVEAIQNAYSRLYPSMNYKDLELARLKEKFLGWCNGGSIGGGIIGGIFGSLVDESLSGGLGVITIGGVVVGVIIGHKLYKSINI